MAEVDVLELRTRAAPPAAASDDLVPVWDRSTGLMTALEISEIAAAGGVIPPVSVTGGSWQSITAVAFGGDNGGVVDNAPAFAAVAAAGNLDTFFPSGTYVVASDVTIAFPLHIAKGAKIKPASGKTVFISGPIDAGAYQIFDFSAGGTFSFSGNRSIAAFNPKWFGVVGDGATDDQPAITKMVAAIPDGSFVAFPGNLKTMLRSPWVISGRKGITFYAPTGGVTADTSVEVRWDGDWGSRAILLDRGHRIKFVGAFIMCPCPDPMMSTIAATIGAGSAILNDFGVPRFASNMVGRRVAIPLAGLGGRTHITRVLTYNSPTQLVLQDAAVTAVTLGVAHIGTANGLPAHATVDCTGMPGDGDEIGYGDITTGTKVLTAATSISTDFAYWFPDLKGRSITVPGAGVAGADLVTTIDEWITGKKILLADAASTTVVGATWRIQGLGGPDGIGTACEFEGFSMNASACSVPEINHLRISVTADQNHEFYRVTKGQFYGGGTGYFGNFKWQVTTTAGSPTLTSAAQFNYPVAGQEQYILGQRVRVENAAAGPSASVTYDPPSIGAGSSTTTDVTLTGVSVKNVVTPTFSLALGGIVLSATVVRTDLVRVTFSNPTGAPINLGSGTLTVTQRACLDARIIARASASSITIDKNADFAVTDSYSRLGEGMGDMIVIGPSANAHGHIIEENNFTAMRRGVDAGSSYIGTKPNTFATGGDLGYYSRGSTRPCNHGFDVMEGTGAYFYQALAGPGVITFQGAAIGADTTLPNGSVFSFANGMQVALVGNGHDSDPPGISTSLFNFSRCGSGTFDGTITRHYPSGNATMKTSGYATVPLNGATITVNGDTGLTDAPGGSFVLNGSSRLQTVRPVITGQINHLALAVHSATVFRFDCTIAGCTLEVTATLPVGWWCDVRKVDATANAVTVTGTGCTFNGAASLTTTTQHKNWTLYHAGSGVYEILATI